MTRGMKADAHAADRDGFAVGNRLDDGSGPEAPRQERRGRCGAQVGAGSGARVVAVGVRDDGAIHRSPRIDIERPRGAIQTVGLLLQQSVSPDGRLLASSDANGAAVLWDVSQHEPIARLSGRSV